MGTVTFDNFKTYLKLRFGNDDNLDSGTNYYGKWINDAYNLLTTQQKFWGLRRRFRFPELETSASKTTSDGTYYVETPTDCLYVLQVYDETNDYLLRNIPLSKYLGYTDRSNTSVEGVPTEWIRSGANIYLHPTPDATYTLTVHYRKRVTALTGTDATAIGPEWDDIILDIATYIGKMYMRQFEEAKLFKAEATEKIAGILSLYDQEEMARNEYWRIDENYIDPGY